VNSDLSDQEIDQICDGLTQSAARIRYLRRMGLVVRQKPNGKPLVNRTHYEATMNNSARIEQRSSRTPAWSIAA
jgi:hypothetical protein